VPQIPTVVSPEYVAYPTMSPEKASEGYKAQGQAFEKAGNVADYGQQIFRALDRAETHVKLLQARNEIEDDINVAAVQLKDMGDPDSIEGLRGQIH